MVILEPGGRDVVTVKSREKTAKMLRAARRTEMRLEETRGTGRPKRTCCLGIVKGWQVVWVVVLVGLPDQRVEAQDTRGIVERSQRPGHQRSP
jgi:hypothetical protein